MTADGRPFSYFQMSVTLKLNIFSSNFGPSVLLTLSNPFLNAVGLQLGRWCCGMGNQRSRLLAKCQFLLPEEEEGLRFSTTIVGRIPKMAISESQNSHFLRARGNTGKSDCPHNSSTVAWRRYRTNEPTVNPENNNKSVIVPSVVTFLSAKSQSAQLMNTTTTATCMSQWWKQSVYAAQ